MSVQQVFSQKIYQYKSVENMGLEITDHMLHVSNTIRRIDFLITFLPQEVTIRIGRLPPYLLKLKYGLNTLCFCHFVNAFDFDNIFIHFGKSFFKIKPTHDCSYLKIVLFEDKKSLVYKHWLEYKYRLGKQLICQCNLRLIWI